MTDVLALSHVQFAVDDGIATVLLDRKDEAMNTLNPEVAADLLPIMERLETDDEIRGVVIGSAKPTNFVAGADVRWLHTLEDSTEALDLLREAHGLYARLENLHVKGGKPVVAAIHGACLGGGLELALACSLRICSSDAAVTQLGQPEVKLGILPAAGGTQRLPRLIGIAAGLDLMLTGRSLRPHAALKMGLVDEVAPRDLLISIATERARRHAAERTTPRGQPTGSDGRSSDPAATALAALKDWLSPRQLRELALEDNPVGRRVLFAKATEQMMAETRGNYPAPKAIIRVVKTGVDEGIDAGYAAELDEFSKLVVSAEAKALMQVFFDSQATKHDTGDAQPVSVTKAAVIGGGLMGGGIAAVNALQTGVRTRMKEVDHEGVGRGLRYVNKVVAGWAKKRRLKPSKSAELMQLVTGTTDWSGFGDVELVIEAVFEDLDLKRTVLSDVEGVTGERSVFASNTSSLPITDIAAGADRPENVVGMHYFSPVEKMPLLEVITTEHTADWVEATAVEFGKRQGKIVIVVNDGPGFYTTRVLGPYTNEVFHLLSEGVPVDDIDNAMMQWGFPVGPLQLMDEVGIDVGAKIAKIMADAFGDRLEPPGALTKLVADDRKGRKNGRGFYRYEEGKRSGVDETVYETLGVEPTTKMATSAIQDRLALQFIGEAVRCLEDGVLRSARDGDVGAVFGLGFPPFRGGPFTFIDQTTAEKVRWKLDKLAAQHGSRFETPALLAVHAGNGDLFRSE